MAEKPDHVNAHITNIWNRIKQNKLSKRAAQHSQLTNTWYIWRKVSVQYRENKINTLQPNEPPHYQV